MMMAQNFHAITVITGRNEKLNNLIPVQFKHPIAETKHEALSWCFKHERWHCAEMEAIKRDVGHATKWMK